MWTGVASSSDASSVVRASPVKEAGSAGRIATSAERKIFMKTLTSRSGQRRTLELAAAGLAATADSGTRGRSWCHNTGMTQPLRLLAVAICALAVGVVPTVSAQYAGWTIPPTAKEEKSPLKPTPDVLKRGLSVFTAQCQKCHGPQGKGDGPDSDPRAPAADLTDEFRIELNPDGVLYHKIWNGRPPAMPAFKSALTPDQVWQVVEYIKTLRKPA
jgi:mono/diheme cytochrome c family protein